LLLPTALISPHKSQGKTVSTIEIESNLDSWDQASITMVTTTDDITIDDNNNGVVMIFKSSLVRNVASSKVRLPSNFVGVRCVRRERECNSSKNTNTQSTSDNPLPSANDNNDDDDADDEDDKNVARNNKYVKFVVVDENGNERRMTKAEKKKKKRQLAKQNKEQAQQNSAKRQKLEEEISSTIPSSTKTATEGQEGKSSPSSSSYHQLPINPTTMDQELADFKGERAGLPTVLLSPPMALQFFTKNLHVLPEIIPLVVDKEELLNDDEIVEDAHNNNNYYDANGDGAVLIHSHSMAEEWSNRLKEKCILPAEFVRQKEDLRPLAYRLHPEPWQRMRPTPIKEQPMLTTSRSRNRNHNLDKDDRTKSLVATTTEDPIIVNPNPRDWITLTCRPRLTSSSSSSSSILQHDDIISIVFEYLHRETPFYLSCGAKFGSDLLIYDGPRESRHAFAGLRVLSRFTNSMTSSSSLLPATDKDVNILSSSSELQLPLPTAFSLTSFVRCLNTAGKLALLATVEEVEVVVPDNNEKQKEGSNGDNDIDQNDIITRKNNNNNNTTHYRVAFVDVALEKVLDVHKRKKGSSKKKLQKRRDVTQNLAKK
jgi:hypothetical protein